VRILTNSRAAALYLAIGAVVTSVYFLLPTGGIAQSVVYDTIGVASAAAIAAAVRLHRPEAPLPWLLFALGNLCFAVADIIFNIGGTSSTPSVADVFYLGGYPLLAAGLVLLLIGAGGRHRTAALVEAAIVTVAFALFQWVFVMDGILDGNEPLRERVVVAAYPAMDFVLLACVAGFFATAVWRSPAFTLLVASLAALLFADEAYGVGPNSYRNGDWIDAGWLLSYVLWAVAALHPSMRQLSQPRERRVVRVRTARIALLTAALLAAPVVLFEQWVRDASLDVPAVVIASVLISILVVARLTGILRAAERLRVRELEARADAIQAQMELAAQNELLVKADLMKDEFVALISHDLRTPLTSIIGYVELSLDDDPAAPLDDERRGYLSIVARSSQRLLQLVDDLLFVARLRTGELDLNLAELDLSEMVTQTVDEMRPRAESKGLELVLVAAEPAPITADRGRLFQLLDNVVSNAIKFTPQGGRIEVCAERTPAGGRLEVRDSGIGLGGVDTERVFEQFFRTPEAVEQQIPGTGLGLFISRAIAEAHGGTIAALARPGGGTVFRIDLPDRIPAGKEPELVT
jgi:signal transduction histidine kinase